MCGIAGLQALTGCIGPNPNARARSMADALSHRGPDDAGVWADEDAGIALAHRRLAIVDLTALGAQPMHSADGRYVITFNGEIYNFPELRSELAALGHQFKGTSDTEVMLAAIVQWGLHDAVKRFVGMFAFALFDRSTRRLSLVRDRLGVKPLYWTIADGTLLFGSELRALMAHQSFRRDVDPNAIASVVRYSYIPAPATIFRGTYKLPPGSILTAQLGAEVKIDRYWSLLDSAGAPSTALNREEAVERLDDLLRQSVRQRMIADVPIGAFLSGGIDSGTVVALMQAVSNQTVRTFTVGFNDASYNEANEAAALARHIGSDHTEMTLEPEQALGLVNNIADWFDEPFADSSQLPTYLVARATRQHVTVALSGDGGDELFGGYPKYQSLAQVWAKSGHLPQFLRTVGAGLLRHAPEPWVRTAASLIVDQERGERLGEKLRRLASALKARSIDEASLAISQVGLAADLVPGALPHHPTNASAPDNITDVALRMQLHDTLHYLPDDILTKVDRCTMAVSLEAREPLLDHRLVEFVWQLPAAVRANNGQPKSLLRDVFARYAPTSLIDRPKRGFSIPLGRWLSGPLREWADDLLDPRKLATEGFDADAVRRTWQRHLSGREQNATGLWNILMIRAWFERWMPA